MTPKQILEAMAALDDEQLIALVTAFKQGMWDEWDCDIGYGLDNFGPCEWRVAIKGAMVDAAIREPVIVNDAGDKVRVFEDEGTKVVEQRLHAAKVDYTDSDQPLPYHYEQRKRLEDGVNAFQSAFNRAQRELRN